MCVSLCLCDHVSVCPYVCTSICLGVHMSVHQHPWQWGINIDIRTDKSLLVKRASIEKSSKRVSGHGVMLPWSRGNFFSFIPLHPSFSFPIFPPSQIANENVLSPPHRNPSIRSSSGPMPARGWVVRIPASLFSTSKWALHECSIVRRLRMK